MGFLDEYNKIFVEYFDISDDETRERIVSLDENEKGQLVVSLTSRLYDKIVEKTTEIDFGTIPESRGDITKIENFDSLMECIDILTNILKEYNQPTTPVDTVYTAVNNVRSKERLFSKAFAVGAEMPIILYNTIVLSIVSSVSLLISGCIEFIKNTGDNSYTISLDKAAYKRTAESMLFEDLEKFNKACSKKEFDDMLEYTIKASANTKALTGETFIVGLMAASSIVLLSRQIIPILQELVYFFFHARQTVSDYFAIQADLITINASNVMYRSNIDDNEKKKISDKQMKIATSFRKISNVFDISTKKAERDSKKMANDEKRKYKTRDVEDTDIESSIF